MAPELQEFAGSTIENRIRTQAMAYVATIMEEKVNVLRGSPYRRKGKSRLFHREGSEPGSITISASRTGIQKPGVRGNGNKIHLKSYETLFDSSSPGDYIYRLMLCLEFPHDPMTGH